METYTQIFVSSLQREENNNGIQLQDFAVTNNMAIISTLFPYKNIHKGAWRAPHGKTKN
jgi:hypothetical protein